MHSTILLFILPGLYSALCGSVLETDSFFYPPFLSLFSLPASGFANTPLHNQLWTCLPIGIIWRWLFTILILLGDVLEDHSWQWVVHVHDAQNEGTWFCWIPWHSPKFTVVYIGSGFHCFSVPLKTTLVPLYTHRPSARFFFSYFFYSIKTI